MLSNILLATINVSICGVSSVFAGNGSADIDEQNNVTYGGDWSYLFMPDPIVGGTENIEEMYDK